MRGGVDEILRSMVGNVSMNTELVMSKKKIQSYWKWLRLGEEKGESTYARTCSPGLWLKP